MFLWFDADVLLFDVVWCCCLLCCCWVLFCVVCRVLLLLRVVCCRVVSAVVVYCSVLFVGDWCLLCAVRCLLFDFVGVECC